MRKRIRFRIQKRNAFSLRLRMRFGCVNASVYAAFPEGPRKYSKNGYVFSIIPDFNFGSETECENACVFDPSTDAFSLRFYLSKKIGHFSFKNNSLKIVNGPQKFFDAQNYLPDDETKCKKPKKKNFVQFEENLRKI